MYYLSTEDFVANALIALIEKENVSNVSLLQLLTYRRTVMSLFALMGRPVASALSVAFEEVVEQYPMYFHVTESNCIALNADKTVKDLKNLFRANSQPVISVFISKPALRSLGID